MLNGSAGWQDYTQQVAHATHTVVGTLKVRSEVFSPQLRNERSIYVYLPPSYHHSERRYPVLYMHDGQNLFDQHISYAGEWQVDETMEALSGAGQEAIVVGIPNSGTQRIDEYSPFRDARAGGGRGDDYLSFLVDTIKPLIDRDFLTLPDREHTGILGSSMGGLISLYAAVRCPRTFGFAGVMSPSLWFAQRAIFPVVQRARQMSDTLYVDIGTAEGTAMVQNARRLHGLLQRKGYRDGINLDYVEAAGAPHSEAAWAERLPAAIRFFLGQRVPTTVQPPLHTHPAGIGAI